MYSNITWHNAYQLLTGIPLDVVVEAAEVFVSAGAFEGVEVVGAGAAGVDDELDEAGVEVAELGVDAPDAFFLFIR
jgi:hypothetical protein